MSQNAKLIKRNNKIRARFRHLSDEKHYNTDYCLELLEDEFMPLMKETIWLIVSKTGYYKDL